MRISAKMLVFGMLVGAATPNVAVTPVVAADLAPASPSPTAPVLSFTGCHVGLHAGGVIGASDDWTPVTQGGAFVGQSLGSHEVAGLAGGA